jgi:medium-chain acyl-[acyl-carrier-protein] hydrolase
MTVGLPNGKFIQELRKFNGTRTEVLQNQELMSLLIDALRADFEAVETYEYRQGDRLRCPISVYGGVDDEHVPVEGCRAWQEQTSAECRVKMFKGDHFFVRRVTSGFKDEFQGDVLRATGYPISVCWR